MSTEEFIIALFVRVDDVMGAVPLHPQGLLYPSEIVTVGLLYALKGGASGRSTVGSRATIGPCSPSCPNARGCSAC